ncbi:MAG: GNAT family N-acetyltransferase [Rhodobacteraceae bacterium]|nr:GNAT family N-acetyltransferase [Paracoccaceae bacterium]
MTQPDLSALYEALEATWPPARAWQSGPFTLRDGAGGGKRVSAATANGPASEDEIRAASDAMRAIGQPALFQIRADDEDLDARLATLGFDTVDPTTFYSAPLSVLTPRTLPPVSAFLIPEPLAIMVEIWAAGGIGPGRLAVMDRAPSPKTTVLGRTSDRAVGAGFAAIHNGIAMIHALEVLPEARRKGTAQNMITALTQWADAQGAAHLALAVTGANDGANALYAALGMAQVGGYHYRIQTAP